MPENRGGARRGAGRPPKVAIELPKGLAQEIQALPESKTRWLKLCETNDEWLQFRVMQYIWDRAEGKPTIIVAKEPDKPPAEVTFGNLSMPAADQSRKPGQPN